MLCEVWFKLWTRYGKLIKLYVELNICYLSIIFSKFLRRIHRKYSEFFGIFRSFSDPSEIYKHQFGRKYSEFFGTFRILPRISCPTHTPLHFGFLAVPVFEPHVIFVYFWYGMFFAGPLSRIMSSIIFIKLLSNISN